MNPSGHSQDFNARTPSGAIFQEARPDLATHHGASGVKIYPPVSSHVTKLDEIGNGEQVDMVEVASKISCFDLSISGKSVTDKTLHE